MRKAASRRLELITALRISIRNVCGTVARRLGERPAAPRGAEASYRTVFDHLHAELIVLERQLTVAEGALDDAKARFQKRKRQRQEARQALGCKHRRSRRLLSGFFQPAALARAGLTRLARPSAPELVSQVARTIRVLGDLGSLGPPIVDLSFDAQALAGQLTADLGRLETAIAGLEAARGTVVTARSLAGDAIAETDRTAPWIGRCVENLFPLADEGLARRLTSRRRR